MQGYFTKFQDSSNQYRFNLKAANHEIILQSEAYTTAYSRDNGISSVKTNSPYDKNYERLTAKNGQPYFVLKANNNQVIGVSETYNSIQSREVGITACKRVAPSATVREASR